jgi:hypothetical protein
MILINLYSREYRINQVTVCILTVRSKNETLDITGAEALFQVLSDVKGA